jgi:hypothetical protein
MFDQLDKSSVSRLGKLLSKIFRIISQTEKIPFPLSTRRSTILTNQLPHRLPQAFVSEFASRGISAGELAYSAIPFIKPLPEPLRSQVRQAFALSIRTIWISMTAVTVIGLVASLLTKSYPLNTAMDEDWGLERKERVDEEVASTIVEKPE